MAKLEKTGATFTIMNGYLEGRLTDTEGAAMLLASARETVAVGKRLGVQRLNLHGTGLGDMGVPIPKIGAFAPGMVVRARDTLNRICDLAEAEGVVFTLENLNPIDHPGCPFGSTTDVLALVSSINRPQLRINLDLYHTQIGEGDLIRWCEACLPWIGEVQVADNPGRCEPGTGEINYAGVARSLAAMGYDGPVGLEAFAKGSEDAALDAFRSAFTV
ncbi:TIM barrel protein [Thioclava sp. FR2]|uniref:TIM barrel protein n=1 Tax=Thioclava sp. FR2 TaxID=3445780 RepID=UPI003EB6ECD9